jgi:hypothetical protein
MVGLICCHPAVAPHDGSHRWRKPYHHEPINAEHRVVNTTCVPAPHSAFLRRWSSQPGAHARWVPGNDGAPLGGPLFAYGPVIA